MGVRHDCEWNGGQVSPPFSVEDGTDVGLAALVVWMEAPSGLAVACEAIGSGDVGGAVTRVLLAALEQPPAGSRRPDRIRVADASLAAEVRAAVGWAIRVAVWPTPEIDVFLDAMLDSMADERSDLGEPDIAPATGLPFQPKVGRNAPCPCGSGHKYKKCHLPLDEAEHAATHTRSRLHALDGRMVRTLTNFAERRFGDTWMRFEDDFEDPDEAVQLAAPWSVYGFRVDGQTIVEAYLETRGTRCSADERAWLAAQQAAWLAVWEVIAVDPGTSLTLRDLLSGETRHVGEVSGSQTLVVRDALLARVVDHDDGALLCGSHPRPLPPFDAAEVVRRARGRLRRKRAVPVERLREAAFGSYLIRRWEDAMVELDVRSSIPLELRNTDGDPLLLTTDHFAITPDARPTIERQLAALDGVDPPGPGEDPSVFTFLRPGSQTHASPGATVVGHAWVTDTTLRLETNSRKRADALRTRVENACGEPIRYRIREHTDPRSPKVAADVRAAPPAPPPPEAEQFLLEFKQRHYALGATSRCRRWPARPPGQQSGRRRVASTSTYCSRTWKTTSSGLRAARPSISPSSGVSYGSTETRSSALVELVSAAHACWPVPSMLALC